MLSVPVYAYIYVHVFPRSAPSPPPAPNLMITYILVGTSLLMIPFGFFLSHFINLKSRSLFMVNVAVIVGDAFFESIAIYGLVGYFLGMPDAISYGLMGLSFCILLLNTIRVLTWLGQAE
jgi:hypothetical protein